MAAPVDKPKSWLDQIADRHAELESLVKEIVPVVGAEWRKATQPDRTQEWYLSVLLVGAVLTIIVLSALLSATGHFASDVAFVMGTALGAFAAILKDFLLPVQ